MLHHCEELERSDWTEPTDIQLLGHGGQDETKNKRNDE